MTNPNTPQERAAYFRDNNGEVYELGARLGSGTFANVVTAYPTTETRGTDYQNPLALKLFKDDVLRKNRDVFNRETAALSRVGEHPNVIRVVGYGLGSMFKDGDQAPSAYISMEYADGGSVASQAPLPLYQTLQMGYQALSGLVSLHGWGMVHRDIKIENILVTGEKAEQPTFKLGDFGGVDEIYRGTPQSRQKDIVATRRGAPSETYERKATERTDIYGLGVALAEAVTNQVAKDKKGRVLRLEELAEIAGIARDKSIQELGRIILIATQNNPHDRYSSALSMQADLFRMLQQETGRMAGSGWRYRPIGGRRIVEGLSRTKEVTDSLGVSYSSTKRGVSGMSVVEELVNGELVPMLRPAGKMGRESAPQMAPDGLGSVARDRMYGALENAWESMQHWAEQRFHKRQIVSPLERGQPDDRDMQPMTWLQGSMADKFSSVQARAERRYSQREVSAPLEYDASVKGWRVRFNNKPLPGIANMFKNGKARAGKWIDGRLDKLDAWLEKTEAAKAAAAQLKAEEERRRELDEAWRSRPPVPPQRNAPEVRYTLPQEVQRAAASTNNGGKVPMEDDNFQGESDPPESKPELGRRHFLMLGALAAGSTALGLGVFERLSAPDVSGTVFELEKLVPKEEVNFRAELAKVFVDSREPFHAQRIIRGLEEQGAIMEAVSAAMRLAHDYPLESRITLHRLRQQSSSQNRRYFDDYSAILALNNPELVTELKHKYTVDDHMWEFYETALKPERTNRNREVLQHYINLGNYWHPSQLAHVLAVRNPQVLIDIADRNLNDQSMYQKYNKDNNSAFGLLRVIAEELIPTEPEAANKLMQRMEAVVRPDGANSYPLELAMRFASYHPRFAYEALQRYRSYGNAWVGASDVLSTTLAPHIDGMEAPKTNVGKAWFDYVSNPHDKDLKTRAMDALQKSKYKTGNAQLLSSVLLRGHTRRY